jgi:F-type H+-transporting ATPase subunit b
MASETHSSTGAHAGEDHGPTLLGLSAEGWVYTGVTLFILLAVFVFKAHRKIVEALDGRIADAKREIDEAAKIRKEAEALLADAKNQQKVGKDNATAMIASAEAEAAQLVTKIEADATALIARRTKSAEEKIAAAERSAIADVRAKAASAAAAAAAALIAQHHDGKADAGLIDETIAKLN